MKVNHESRGLNPVCSVSPVSLPRVAGRTGYRWLPAECTARTVTNKLSSSSQQRSHPSFMFTYTQCDKTSKTC